MEGLVSFAVLVALTSGVTEVIKKLIGLKTGIVPAVALIIGLIITAIGAYSGLTPLTILTGIAVGLSASGLYDITKHPIKAIRGK